VIGLCVRATPGLKDSVRPRRLGGASGRPHNFAVRLHRISGPQ
jgi:hypothetical protein